MDYTIIWSVPAQLDLKTIVEFIAIDSLPAAQKVHVEIDALVRQLRRLPFMGAVFEKERSRRVREIQYHKYRIFYELDETDRTVHILTIWHGARREATF